jgi:methylaspartate ammonia-lyase
MSGEGGEVGIDVDAVMEHGTKIRHAGDEIEGIGKSAAHTNLGWDVYGFVGRPVAMIFSHIMGEVGELISHVGEKVGEAGQDLSQKVDHGYRGTDTGNADELGSWHE